MIDFADKDRDGIINYDEFISIITKDYPKIWKIWCSIWFNFKPFLLFFLLSYKMHLINDLIDLWNLQMKRFWITFWALNKRNLYYELFHFTTWTINSIVTVWIYLVRQVKIQQPKFQILNTLFYKIVWKLYHLQMNWAISFKNYQSLLTNHLNPVGVCKDALSRIACILDTEGALISLGSFLFFILESKNFTPSYRSLVILDFSV